MPQPIPLKDHEKEKHLVNRRLLACATLVFSLVAVLVGRLYVLQVLQHDQQTAVSENNRVHVLPIAPERGLIYDRNGVVLADNKPSFDLTMTRERAGGDSAKVLDTLTQVLGLTEDDRKQFDKDLRRGRKPFEPVTLMVGLSEEQIALVAVNQFRLPGLEVEPQFIREYPLAGHFAHSVGYVGRINEKEAKVLDSTEYRGTQSIGKTGIEHFYESQLHGHVGYEEVETNAQGRVMRVLNHKAPTPGQDIVLTLDAHLQVAAEKALATGVARWWYWTRPTAMCWQWSATPASTPTCSSRASASSSTPNCAIPSTARCSTACCAACMPRARR